MYKIIININVNVNVNGDRHRKQQTRQAITRVSYVRNNNNNNDEKKKKYIQLNDEIEVILHVQLNQLTDTVILELIKLFCSNWQKTQREKKQAF